MNGKLSKNGNGKFDILNENGEKIAELKIADILTIISDEGHELKGRVEFSDKYLFCQRNFILPLQNNQKIRLQ